jgi:ubiquinone/menaquinone biosynthesis C-methylase UbiE
LTAIQRNIFVTGEYISAFRPEERDNPFREIYARKRVEVLAMADEALAGRTDAKVLDIGGGMGRIAVPLAQRARVALCDISEAMLEQARVAADAAGVTPGRLTTRLVDASQLLPFNDATFDLVICLDLLVHLPEPQAAVRELYRVLRPGGTALIDATNSVPLWVFTYPRYVGKRPIRWLQTLRYGGVLPEWAKIVHHMRRSDLQRWLQTAGFVVIGERRYGRVPWLPKWFLMVARRPA